MGKLRFEPTELPAVVEVHRDTFRDARGAMSRLFCANELTANGLTFDVAQSNLSWSTTKGTLRGFHFQRAPQAEAKLVTCISGAILDAAVDLRAGSPNYGRWVTRTLSGDKMNALLIPPGFGHGFQTLTDDVGMVYFHSVRYAPETEGGVNALDADIALPWPEEVTVRSNRDAALPPLKDLEPLA